MKKTKNSIELQGIILIFAISSVMSKIAAKYEFLTKEYVFYLFLVFLFLGIYAVLWQQVLKKTALTFAYVSKATTIIWGLIFGHFLFNERISVLNIVGSLIVIVGIIIMTLGGHNNG